MCLRNYKVSLDWDFGPAIFEPVQSHFTDWVLFAQDSGINATDVVVDLVESVVKSAGSWKVVVGVIGLGVAIGIAIGVG